MKGRVALAAAALSLSLSACSEPKPEPKHITWADYEKVQPGMTYHEVVELFGDKGTQSASNEIDGRLVRTYTFGPDGVMIFFDGDKVGDKMPGSLQAPPLP